MRTCFKIVMAFALLAGAVNGWSAATQSPSGTGPIGRAQQTAGRLFGDTLSGQLPKMVKASGGPYVVSADIVVPQGKTVIIEPGTVFLFRNFSGLKVQGTLLAQGTAESPIIFTSINDRAYNPQSAVEAAPYDWNGIYVYEDAIGSYFAYCTIFYSVYGINSVTKFIRIGPSIFKNNGRANVTIEGAEHQVGDKPFEYSLTVKDAGANGVPLTILRDPNATKRALLRYGGGSLLTGGLILGIVYTTKFSASISAFNSVSATDANNLATGSSSQWSSRRSTAVVTRFWMTAGYIVAAFGATGIAWSFTF